MELEQKYKVLKCFSELKAAMTDFNLDWKFTPCDSFNNIVFFDLLEFLTLEFIGVTLRLVQTLSNFNSSLNALVNSHVHLEKLNDLESNQTLKNPIEFNIEKINNNTLKNRCTVLIPFHFCF